MKPNNNLENILQRRGVGLLGGGVLAVIFSIAAFAPMPHPDATGSIDTGAVAWMLTASGLVLLMTPGLSYFYGGMVNSRNVISTMLQSFVALGVVSILWYVVGFSLAFGDSIGGIIGDPRTFLFFNNVGTAPHPHIGGGLPLLLFAAFQLKFAIITPALITGSFAERVRFRGYTVFIILFTLLVYCPLAHATWHPDGILAKAGILDFAGGTVVHVSAGLAALAGAMFLGRRHSHTKGEAASPTNIPYVILGTGLLWFGWFGFNAGSALGANGIAITSFVTTNLASASAMITWMLIDVARGQKPTALGACIGAVVGLVAITPGAGFVGIGSSLLIGAVAALASNFAVHWKTQTNIDDTLDVFPCHGVGGMVGMILTAVFATTGGLITGSPDLLIRHIIALIAVSIIVFVISYLLFYISAWITPLRVTLEHELIGLDLSQHGETVMEVGSIGDTRGGLIEVPVEA
ncbi:MAG: ammonium transporter [Candidatus Kapaibacterium sp.]